MTDSPYIHDPGLNPMLRELADEGKLMESGWNSLRMTALPADAPVEYIEELRLFFYAGARYLFASTIAVTEPGDNPEKNLKRMKLIKEELMTVTALMYEKFNPHGGVIYYADMEKLKTLGFQEPRKFDNDHWAAIIVLPTGQYAIVDGDRGSLTIGYRNRWNYELMRLALSALEGWDGTGEPGGYISKELNTLDTIWP